MNFLFWNCQNKPIDTTLAQLISENCADFIALAEYGDDGRSLINELSKLSLDFYIIPQIACKRILLLCNFSTTNVKHNIESERYTIKQLTPPGIMPINICAVHLPSKHSASNERQEYAARLYKRDIERAEKNIGNTDTIVFGDFNMNPFEDGMMAADGFNSVPCSIIANSMSRNILGDDHTFFYNPSWNLLGDIDDSPGTYYLSSPDIASHYWNLLDQVLIRPSMTSRFDKKSLKIIKKTSSLSLVNSKGRPNVSDHLPIFFTIT